MQLSTRNFLELRDMMFIPSIKRNLILVHILDRLDIVFFLELITTQIVLFHTLNTPGFKHFLRSNQPN